MTKAVHYRGIDGLRTIAALGIIAVHVAKNSGYNFQGFIYTNVICKLEVFVGLFFAISGFAMFCGYYTKIKNNEISVNDFYLKRYKKIFPFFSVLVLCDAWFSWSGIATLAEAFADLTLVFAFLPAPSISVVGVGWTLGVIFAFYLLFPFFVFITWDRKRALFTLLIAEIYVLFGNQLLVVNEKLMLCNILTWSTFFILGGIIYLYKEEVISLAENNKKKMLIIGILSIVLWMFLPDRVGEVDLYILKILGCSGVWIVYAIGCDSKVLANKLTGFISSISLEIYLAHMFVYRLIKKKFKEIDLNKDSVISFLCIYVLTILGTIIFSVLFKKITEFLSKKKKGID